MKTTKIDQVLRVVCRHYGVKRDELLSPCRKALLVEARAMAIVMLRCMRYSYPVIGSVVHRDHSTTIYLYHTMLYRINNNIAINLKYKAIRKELARCLN